MSDSFSPASVREALLAVARENSPGDELRCHALIGLMDACRALRRELRRELALCDLTENGFQVLAQVVRHEPAGINPGAVAEDLDLSAQSISSILGRLEISGLITRGRSPENRRLLAIHATAAGRRAFAGALSHFLAAIVRLMSVLDTGDTAKLDRACARLREISLQASAS